MYKPVILIGNGCRRNPALVEYLCSLGIPVLTTWPACDLVAEDSPVFCGRPGGIGQRAANIIQQKASHLIVIGARLDEQQVSFDYWAFGKNAQYIDVFDIDKDELDKLPNSNKWRKHNLNAKDIATMTFSQEIDPSWLAWCRALYARFRPELDGTPGGKWVDPFYFVRLLSQHSKNDDILAMGSSGTAPNTFLQAFKIKQGQKFVNASTMGLMGADIPMAIGACIGGGGRRTLCATGDGSFMLNIQELEVVRRLNLPIKFFVYNNNGYTSIRNMQNARFGGFHVACDPASGMTLPNIADRGYDIASQADAYRIASSVAKDAGEVESFFLSTHFTGPSPYILELMIDPAFEQFPKVVNKMVNGQFVHTPMEDLTPPIDDLDELMRWGND